MLCGVSSKEKGWKDTNGEGNSRSDHTFWTSIALLKGCVLKLMAYNTKAKNRKNTTQREVNILQNKELGC